MKREKLLELAAHGRDVGARVPIVSHKDLQAEQERIGEALLVAGDAHWRYGQVASVLRGALLELEPLIIRAEMNENECRRATGQRHKNAADYDYFRAVLLPLIEALKIAKNRNDELGAPTAARLAAAEKRRDGR